ncbi:MAG TPA: hypothetical protein VMW10_00065, partial [Alphaproteobacteria bacterium]|nr:hypothetical protein [Alphaproteobacteria bacterium]
TRYSESWYTVPHKACIDGYIPLMCHSDIFYDFKSQTASGKNRAKFFHSGKKNNWMGNTYQNSNLYRPEENAILSPSKHASYLKAPVWLVHGLEDDNNSPKHSIKFAEAASQSYKEQFVGTSYAPLLGHNYPYDLHPVQAYYEPILQFMDNVRYAKRCGKVFTFNRSQQLATAKINKAANFRMRAHHPTTLARPQERLLNKIAAQYLAEYDIKPGQSIDPEHLSTSFNAFIEDHPQEFLKAVLYLNRKGQFRTKGTFGEKTMEILKTRKTWYEYDLTQLSLNSIRGKLYPYMNSKLDNVNITETIPGTPWWDGYKWITPPPRTQQKTISSTPYIELKRHLGNGDTSVGSRIFKAQKERLRTMFVDLLTMNPEDRPLYFEKADQISTPL